MADHQYQPWIPEEAWLSFYVLYEDMLESHEFDADQCIEPEPDEEDEESCAECGEKLTSHIHHALFEYNHPYGPDRTCHECDHIALAKVWLNELEGSWT